MADFADPYKERHCQTPIPQCDWNTCSGPESGPIPESYAQDGAAIDSYVSATIQIIKTRMIHISLSYMKLIIYSICRAESLPVRVAGAAIYPQRYPQVDPQ